GLVRTRDQKERAAAFARYVESVAAHPLFVGCHWFQYVDEPVTGRTHDGENYNIGFVDVTDTPYPELSEAARAINGKIYRLRAGG
ncbi:MAG TPA: agarase, partial [Candidatus Hydrogenedentes bacterium]|nr:agarase [Candidatus Hydrogenedentota bacterium]